MNVGEPQHITNGAHADALEYLGIRVGLASIADGIDVPDGGGPEDLLTVAVDRTRPEQVFSAARWARCSGPLRLITFGLP